MGHSAAKPPAHKTVTHKSRSKKRFARVDDTSLIQVLKAAGKPIEGEGRARGAVAGGKLVGIYSLPTNNIMELYEAGDRAPVAFVFASLDVWMSFGPEDLAGPPGVVV